MRLVTLAIVVAAVLFGVEAAAVQEQQLPYSGVALTPSGAPVADGLHQMEFRLYTGATASEPVWTELQLVQTRSGSYQVVLGQSRPLPLTTGQQYWLEVLCDGASLGRMPLALLPSQVETKVAARSLQELHLNPVQSAAPDGWVRAGLPTLGGATPPQPLVVNTCEECTTTFWALTGNAGTNPNNNFLGTTDNQPLIIRTNNVNRVRITTGGQIEVLNSARSVSLGEGAGISQDLTAFRNNVFVGFQAGSATETGIRNVAVGSGALSQNIDGSSNTALGSNAMSTLTTGDYNTAIGYGAEVGDGLTNATAIGAFAFAGQSNTVVIGSIQGVNGATATANVGIGTTTPMNRLHVVSTADPLRLEGLLVNSALDNVLVVDASGVVKKRSLSGFVGSTAWLLTGNTLSGGEVLGSLNPQPLVLVTNNVERMRITAAGDVGIGTSTPAARLHVVGTGRFDGQLTVTTGGAAITGNSTVTGTLGVSSDVSVGGNLTVDGNTTLGDAATDVVTVNAGTVALPNIPALSTATEVLVWNGGNVEHRSASGLISGFAWMLGGNTLTSEQTLGTLSAHDLPIITAGTERVRITQAGDVGIGTSTPAARLDVVNPTGGGVLRLQAVVGQTGALLEWVDDLGNTLGVIDGGGLVGIGTATPVQKLHVEGNGTASAVFVNGGVGVGTVNPLATLHVYDEGSTPGATQVVIQAGMNQSGVDLLQWWDNTGTVVLGGIDDAGNLFVNTNTTLGDAATDAVTVNAGTVALLNIPALSAATEVLVWNAGNVERRSAEGLAWLLTGNSGTNPAVNFLGTTDAQPLVIRTNDLERVRITAAGDVGIGTSTPAATLDVVGTAQVSGNTSIGGSLTVAGDATVSGTTVALPNIPSVPTATEVLVWNAGNVERSSASGLISGFAWMLGGNNLALLGEQKLGTQSNHDLPIITNNLERMRITAAGDVGIGTSTPGARLDVVNPTGGGVLRLQAVLGQMGALLEWVDETGTPWGVIDNSGLVGIGTAAPVQKLHVEGNGAVSAVFVEGGVGVGTVNPLATLHVYDEGTLTPGATQVIIQAGANQTGVNLLEWWDNAGTVLGGIDDAGNLFVNTNTTLGDAAGDVVVFNARVGSDVVPSANNMYDLGDDATPLRWRSGYFGTQVKVGASVSLVAATNALEYTGGDGRISVAGASALRVSTNGVERLIVDGSGNVLPGADNAYDLGSATQRWANVYGVNGNFSAVTVSGLTPGSVIFAGAGGALSQDNANFFWDDANNRLGIGTNTPAATLDVVGTAQVSGNTSVGGNLTVDGNTTLGDNAAVDLVTFNARVGSDVVPSANNMYDLGDDATPLRWRSGYFGTQVKVGASVSLVAGMPDRLEYSGDGIVRTSGYLAVETGGAERLRVTAAGDVVVQNQAAGAPTTVLRVLGGNGGAGATQVVLQAGTGQSGVNLLEWRDGTGQLIGVIDDAGFMGIGVNNAGFGGIAAYLHVYSNTAQPAAVFENGIVRIGNIGGSGVSAGPDLQVWDEPGATQVILQLGTAQTGVNLLEWQNAVGTVLGGIDDAGNLFVNTNTTLGDAAGDVVVFNARVGSDVVPSANNMYDLGDDATPLRWRSGYFGTQVKVGASVSLVAATNALEYTGGDGRISVAGASALRVSTNGVERLIVDGSGNVLPGADNAYDLGSATQRWANVYGVNGNFSAVTVSGLTPGSVIFAGAGGALSQDNANFFWDDANNRLGIGTARRRRRCMWRGRHRWMGTRRWGTMRRWTL
jgi:hypothetical protein